MRPRSPAGARSAAAARARPLVAAAGVVLALAPAAWPATAHGSRVQGPRALVAFLPLHPEDGRRALLDFAERRGMAFGLASARLGGASNGQMALDIGQGARVAESVYDRPPARLRLAALAAAGRLLGWDGAVLRAQTAPGHIEPGLLAGAIRARGGRVSYAGVDGPAHLEAAAAAGPDGRVDRLSLGSPVTFERRAIALWRESDVLVARLPEGRRGIRALDRLLRERGVEDLLLALEAPPGPDGTFVATGVAGRGLEGMLRSPTTRLTGLLSSVDVGPTVLRQLGIPVPAEMTGRGIESRPGGGGAQGLEELAARLEVVNERRWPSLAALVAAWLLTAGALAARRGRRGLRAAVRVAFLSAVWLPGVALLTAALRPPAAVEAVVLALVPVLLGAICDRLARWPAPAAIAALAVLLAHALDLAAGSRLTSASLTGPNPAAGVRFYGVGNELEAMLSLSVLIGAGAGLARGPSRAVLPGLATACVVAALVLGYGRLGADVGAVVTLSAGGAGALLAARGRPLRVRTLLIAGAAVPVAVALLVALDALSGGDAHLSRLLERRDAGGALEALGGRLEISIDGLLSGATLPVVALAVVALGIGLRARRRLLAPLDSSGLPSPGALRAGLAGGLCATLAGAVANDGAPVFLLIGAAGLGLAAAYARSGPGGSRTFL